MASPLRNVPVEVQYQLLAELESAVRSFPAERSLTWRGENARGGSLCSSRDGWPRTEAQSAPSASLKAPPAASAEVMEAETGNCWTELREAGGNEAAVCVQRWLMRYVEGLSLDEIELLATPAKSAL